MILAAALVTKPFQTQTKSLVAAQFLGNQPKLGKCWLAPCGNETVSNFKGDPVWRPAVTK